MTSIKIVNSPAELRDLLTEGDSFGKVYAGLQTDVVILEIVKPDGRKLIVSVRGENFLGPQETDADANVVHKHQPVDSEGHPQESTVWHEHPAGLYLLHESPLSEEFPPY